jgi:hypothetical protein
MKVRFLLVFFMAAAAYLIFSSRTTGAGANGLGDLTGSPLSGGTCGNCHSGGNFGASLTITLRDLSNNPVTSYVPGQQYRLEVDVNNSSGSPAGFGAQAVALTSSNANAGTMGTVITTNTRVTAIGGRNYMEQNSVSASGLFQVNWTAPASGTGNVTIYATGNVLNGNGGTSGDQATTGFNLVIGEQVATTINYTQTSYCQNSTNPSPATTGTSGGTFSSTAGLSINASSGLINLAASTPGTYTVTYTYTTGTTTDIVTITAQDAATLTYGTNPSFCASQVSSISPTVTGVLTGTYSASPSGLSIVSNSGLINPSSSLPGSYTVSYTTSGPCPRTVTAPLTILAQDAAAISYGSNPTFCLGQTSTVSPTVTGVQTGTFSSSPSGLSLNSSNGQVNPSTSLAGNYTVSYTTTGVCPRTTTALVTIAAQDVATLSYGNSPSFCTSQSQTVAATITGVQTGAFSATPAGLSFNLVNGTVTPAVSSAGNYTVRYITSGACPDTATATINIIQTDDATFNYTGATFCVTGSNATASTPATGGGTFSASPTGLNLNSTTGVITVANSTIGNYTVSYMTTSGICRDTHSVAVQITAAGSAAFNYAQSAYCRNANNPNATITGISGGTFSSSPAGLSLNSTNGTVNLSASSAGNYTIYYNVTGACPANDSTSLTINAVDVASVRFTPPYQVSFDATLQDSVYDFLCQVPTAIVVNGTQGGTFGSSSASVLIDANTGAISTAVFGTTLFTYTTNGTCPTVDSFWVRSACVGTILTGSELNSLAVYPNPSLDGVFQIENKGESALAHLTLYNELGQKVQQELSMLQGGKRHAFVLNADLPKGSYLLQVQQGTQLQIFRLMYQ